MDISPTEARRSVTLCEALCVSHWYCVEYVAVDSVPVAELLTCVGTHKTRPGAVVKTSSFVHSPHALSLLSIYALHRCSGLSRMAEIIDTIVDDRRQGVRRRFRLKMGDRDNIAGESSSRLECSQATTWGCRADKCSQIGTGILAANPADPQSRAHLTHSPVADG